MNQIKFLYLLVALPLTLTAAPKAFVSPVITKKTPNHQVPITIDITGAKRLYLEVTDGGDGSGYDWADWMEPTLTGPNGKKRLTELKWKKGNARSKINKNQGDGPLKVNGKSVAFGIGTHAESVIVYDLPKGYTTFTAHGGLDNGGVDQKGSRPSVQFHAYTDPKQRPTPPAPPLDITLPTGFAAERIYDVNLGSEGSWVALGLDAKGRLISSDRQGPLFRITVPPIGAKNATAKVEALPVEVGKANGILQAFGSLYVTGIGSGKFNGKSGLFRLTDTNNDDHYDKVEHLISYTVGGDHHGHALLLSPDKKRIVLLAGNSTNLPDEIAARNIQQQAEDHLLPRSTYYGHNTGRMAPGGWIITFQPDGTDRRLHCAGFRNPYDIAFNHAGDLFTFDADMEYDVGGPWYRPTRINHAVSGGEFGWRWGGGKWPTHFPDTVGSVTDIGRGSPTGVAFGYGARFPAKYQRALFALDWTYGKIYAVHMKPDGGTYTGEFETFAAGRAMPVSDVVIHPKDGAMYFTVGGRRTKSSLIRITYTGSESTRPATFPRGIPSLHQTRRNLETLHGHQSPTTVATAWPHLSSPDRAVRYAARTAIEHQPAESWAQRAIKERNSNAAIQAAVALARVGDKKHKETLLTNLNLLEFKTLTEEQQLDLLRAYGLVFIRMGAPATSLASTLSQSLSPSYPAADTRLNHELCQMLLYLKAPGAVSKTVKLLLVANTQADQMFYAYHLRTIQPGWSNSDLKDYFGWIRHAEENRNDYTGGSHFNNFVKMVRKESMARLSPEQKALVEPILASKSKPVVPEITLRDTVNEWTIKDLAPKLARVETGRSFIRGKTLHNTLCATCHLFNGKGGALGPDLTTVGNKYDYNTLLTEIIEPSRVISDQHAAVTLKLKDGTTHFGRETGGDKDSVNIATNPFSPETYLTIKKSDIVERKVSPISMMPLGQLNILSDEEILDLIMYLASGGKISHTAFSK